MPINIFGVIKMKKKIFLLIGILITIYFIIINFHKIKFSLSIINLSLNIERIESSLENVENYKTDLNNPLQTVLESADTEYNTISNTENNSKDIGNLKDNVNNTSNIDEIINSTENIMHTPIYKTKDTSNKNSDPKKSYNEIIQEYNDILEDLKLEFEAELDALIKQGIKEYSLGEISSTKLANKYLSLGADLEKSCDKKFYNLLNIMKNELKANGYDTLITDEIKDYYISFKKIKKMDLINRGMKYIK